MFPHSYHEQSQRKPKWGPVCHMGGLWAAALFCFVFGEAQDSLEKVICVILTLQQLLSCYRCGEPDPSPGTGVWVRRPLGEPAPPPGHRTGGCG